MADNTLRSGLRVFYSGGAEQLDLQELVKVFEAAITLIRAWGQPAH